MQQPTVNFNCPHCGNLMAVSHALLGRNVRCPHCKQVTRAPAAAGQATAPPPPASPAPNPPPPLPKFNVPKEVEDHQSIFGERHDEDVFGSAPPKPTLVLPGPPPMTPPPDDERPTDTHPAVPDPAPTPPVAPMQPDPLVFEGSSPAGDGPAALRLPPAGQARVKVREAAPPTQAFAWIMLAYAAVATALAGFFGYQCFTAPSRGTEHPFTVIPDFYGQYERANRKQLSFDGMPDPQLDVPAELRVGLGESLTVGDLRVTPMSVRKQRVEVVTVPQVGDPIGPRGTGKPTLVLTMRVKNLSADTTFHPNDPAFHRAGVPGQPTPYTALEVSRKPFYGTFHWPPDPGTVKEYIAGHEADEKPLGPGEERDTWVTVAPPGVRAAKEDVLDAIERLKPERLLWRVQLRRGLVKAPAADGGEVELSATAVIGVEFTPDAIK